MKKRLLIVTSFLPFPLSHGGAVSQYFFIDRLKKEFDLFFLVIANSKEKIEQIKRFEQIENIKVFYLEPNKLSLFDKFKNFINYRLSKLFRLQKIDEKKMFDKNKYLIKSLKKIIKQCEIDIIQIEFFHLLYLIKYLPQNKKRIFIHHEVRFKANKKNESNEEYEYNKKVEISLLKKYEKVVVFNDDDFLILKTSEIEQNKIVNSPFGIPNKLIFHKNISSTFEKFIFVGAGFHVPNLEGLKWFLNEIYLPNYNEISWEVHIVGIWREDFKENYKKFNKIKFLGFVDDLGGVFENSVLLNPILSGSGIRTKVLEAFANKVPVISTPIGAEGLYSETEHNHLMIFENEKDFLKIFENNFSNNNLAEISEKGFEYYQKYFNEELLLQKRLSVYE